MQYQSYGGFLYLLYMRIRCALAISFISLSISIVYSLIAPFITVATAASTTFYFQSFLYHYAHSISDHFTLAALPVNFILFGEEDSAELSRKESILVRMNSRFPHSRQDVNQREIRIKLPPHNCLRKKDNKTELSFPIFPFEIPAALLLVQLFMHANLYPKLI